ncbi:MAG TPA: cytochrome c maturation protein CcmE [Gemmatimonadota bacterium]|nr:cytochrome c maturation protein CcmE [Gemmatimonadota bacterium]
MNTEHTAPPGRRPRIGRLAIGIVLVGAALSYLVYAGTKDNLVYYYEVDEVQAAAASTDGRIRVSGDVVEGSIVKDDETREIRFAIRAAKANGEGGYDGESEGQSGDAPSGSPVESIPVVYAGTVPDIFREGIQVVVEGTMGSDGTFQAETLLAKCPSKYQEAGQLSAEPAPAPRS